MRFSSNVQLKWWPQLRKGHEHQPQRLKGCIVPNVNATQSNVWIRSLNYVTFFCGAMVIVEWLGITIRVKINISTFGSYLLSVTRIIESTKLARQIMLSSKLYHLEKFGENVNHCPVTGAIPVPGIPATPEEQISKTNLLITFAFSSYQLTYFTLFFCTFMYQFFTFWTKQSDTRA